jgi:cytochrome c
MRCSLSAHYLLPLLVAVASATAAGQQSSYNLGKTPSNEEIRAMDTYADFEGTGLPPGRGTAKEGAKLYAQLCASCHGPTGEEGRPFEPGGKPPRLVGGKRTLTDLDPIRTVGSFWPFATTIWSYIYHTMPPGRAGSLQTADVYALTAWLLYRNGIIQENAVMDAESLPKVDMPNRHGFVPSRFEDIPDLRKRGCRLGHCP